MKKIISLVVILPLCSLLLAGCSFEELFSKVATSNEEQGAREAYVRNQILESKQKLIEAKKTQFPHFSKLTKVNEADPYQAFVFHSIEGDTLKVDIEAMLPDPNRQIYEVWLRNSATKEVVSLGALQFRQTDDFFLSYSGKIDPQAFSSLILTREANPDTQPETILLTGSLTTSTP